jgi:hypothetical protein
MGRTSSTSNEATPTVGMATSRGAVEVVDKGSFTVAKGSRTEAAAPKRGGEWWCDCRAGYPVSYAWAVLPLIKR